MISWSAWTTAPELVSTTSLMAWLLWGTTGTAFRVGRWLWTVCLWIQHLPSTLRPLTVSQAHYALSADTWKKVGSWVESCNCRHGNIRSNLPRHLLSSGSWLGHLTLKCLCVATVSVLWCEYVRVRIFMQSCQTTCLTFQCMMKKKKVNNKLIHRLMQIHAGLSLSHTKTMKTICLYSDITALPTQPAGIVSPIYCGAVGPELLMRANLNEHPACYLCLHQAVRGFSLRKH